MRPVSTSAAMVLFTAGQPLQRIERPIPAPGPDDVLLRVSACGVCRTDLHVVDDELPGIGHPIVPGHEIVGEVLDRLGASPMWRLAFRGGRNGPASCATFRACCAINRI